MKCYTDPHPSILLALGVFLTHVVRRLYETVFVSRFGRNQMSVTHFVLGLFFYCTVPVAFHGSRADAGVYLFVLDQCLLFSLFISTD